MWNSHLECGTVHSMIKTPVSFTSFIVFRAESNLVQPSWSEDAQIQGGSFTGHLISDAFFTGNAVDSTIIVCRLASKLAVLNSSNQLHENCCFEFGCPLTNLVALILILPGKDCVCIFKVNEHISKKSFLLNIAIASLA